MVIRIIILDLDGHIPLEKYEGYLGEVLSEYEKLYNIELQRCVKLYKSVLNISLMPQTGNLQITKKELVTIG